MVRLGSCVCGGEGIEVEDAIEVEGRRILAACGSEHFENRSVREDGARPEFTIVVGARCSEGAEYGLGDFGGGLRVDPERLPVYVEVLKVEAEPARTGGLDGDAPQLAAIAESAGLPAIAPGLVGEAGLAAGVEAGFDASGICAAGEWGELVEFAEVGWLRAFVRRPGGWELAAATGREGGELRGVRELIGDVSGNGLGEQGCRAEEEGG